MSLVEILVPAMLGSSVLGAALSAWARRPKDKVDSATKLADTATDLYATLAERVETLERERAEDRQTIATQQLTISQQQHSVALQNTALAEMGAKLSILERAFMVLQDWVRAKGGDPEQILANAGHPPGPAGIPNV